MKEVLTDDEKLKLLKNTWIPPTTFPFPELVEGKQKRKFNHDWLKKYKWLAYSQMLGGGLCTQCVLFAPSGAGIGSQVKYLIFFSYAFHCNLCDIFICMKCLMF